MRVLNRAREGLPEGQGGGSTAGAHGPAVGDGRHFFVLPAAAMHFSIEEEARAEVTVGLWVVDTPTAVVGLPIIAFVEVVGEARVMSSPSAADVADLADGKSDGYKEAAARFFGGWKRGTNPVPPELAEALLRLGKRMPWHCWWHLTTTANHQGQHVL